MEDYLQFFDKMDKLTPGVREVIRYAQQEAGRLYHNYIGTEHLLLGIIRKGDGLAVEVLKNCGVDLDTLKLEIESLVPQGNEFTLLSTPEPLESAKRACQYARDYARRYKHSWIGTEHLLLGLLREEDGIASKVLHSLGLDEKTAKQEVHNVLETHIPKQKDMVESKSKTPHLDSFGRDLTELARESKLDPVIGRENEIQRILQILCRRTKNNPVLLGEPGVGKTAIVEGLAQKIVSEDIPEPLMNKRVLCLDLAAIVAGTKYRGQFEERLKAIMNEIRKSKDVIIFIDEIHTLVGAGAAEGAIDASNILKPALSRGEIQCIGATTLDEYRKYIEKDGALERRFQTINIDPPSVDDTIKILRGLKERYEEHHGVEYTEESLVAAANLSNRYISDRYLPDKALDVIDEAGSRARLEVETKPKEIIETERKIHEIEINIETLKKQAAFEECAELKKEKESLILERENKYRDWKLYRSQRNLRRVITEDDVAQIIAKWTGIPMTKIEEGESRKLLRMESELSKRVVGQEEAIGLLAKAIRLTRSGLRDPRRPSGAFIFMGPTGVGKTELAKVLAEFLFDNENALVRVDMSEYMEKFAVSRLIGAPPGYVGYEEGGQLTEKIRRKPFSVVLLDEIEKAHPDVFNILLQVLDDGRLTDNLGHTVDFRNTIIIMTANIGTKKITSMGFQAGTDRDMYEDMKKRLLGEVKKVFRPEFLNRVDDVVVFKELNTEDIKKIIEKMIVEINDRLKSKGIRLHIDPAAKEFLLFKGYEPEYGARHLKRTIQQYIEDPLSMHLLKREFAENSEIEVTVEDGLIKFHSMEGLSV